MNPTKPASSADDRAAGAAADFHTGSIARALAVLEFLDSSHRGWNISELSRQLNVPKSTMHLIVLTLDRLGFITREPGSRRYSLAMKVCELGRGLMQKLLAPEVTMPLLKELAKDVQLTAHLAILEHDQAVYIQKADGPGPVRFDSYVGKRTNLHCTAVGKVLLANTAESKIRHILEREPFARYTRHTLTTTTMLRRELAKVRQLGYAVDDQEEELDVRCVAVPVFRWSGELVAALGVAGTVDQLLPQSIETMSERLRETAQNLTSGSRRALRDRIA